MDTDDLRLAHRALCTPFVDEALFRRALGGGRGDLGAVARYLAIPRSSRPPLSFYFDRAYYLATNPDVAAADTDPLLHFIDSGLSERRNPHPLIDLAYIIGYHGENLGDPPSIEALSAFLDSGTASPSPYLDADFYRGRLGEAAPATQLLRHYLTAGIAGGHPPNPYFDPVWYGARNAEARGGAYAALRHFAWVGDGQARAAGPGFDGALYWRRYTDVADARMAPLRHYLLHGRQEGRQAANERPAPPPRREAEPAPAAEPDLRARIAEMRGRRKESVAVAAPKLLRSRQPARDIAALKFPKANRPVLSILVPAYNEVDVTTECLMALVRFRPRAAFEVVLADDASDDPAMAAFAEVPNLVYRRNPTNLGFLASCNAAFAACRGTYVLLLNNDAQVTEGAIERMIAALEEDAGLGAVGPKLIYPDGRLQEAGCFLTPDGESGMVGLFADPDEAGYRRDRDVAYCSGAALMLRRSAVAGDLFDTAYAPAYCEDVDLCLRLRAAGHGVRYVHAAVVVHHLSVSTNRQSQSRRLRRVARNQQVLAARWGDTLAAMNRVRGIAFYLPQFHPTPENDLWWGAGFTEWTNVARARPSYAGHYQPHLPADLGFYDLRVPEAMARQAELAARYGIEGFCVYYYNFGDRRVLHRPLEMLRANPDIPFRWCLCWANENWTRHWDGGEREILLAQRYDDATLDAIIADAVRDAADPRYLRVNGRPLFLVYRPLLLPDAPDFARRCRAAFARAGFPGVHLVYVESMEAVDRGIGPADLGFDASVEFPPHGRAVPSEAPAEIVKEGWAGYRYDYPATALAFIGRETVAYPRYPAIFPSWDNTPRQNLKGTSFDGTDPATFQAYAEAKIAELDSFHFGEERLLFINAWNEWAEGAHLEPDGRFGHRWLEAWRDALGPRRPA